MFRASAESAVFGFRALSDRVSKILAVGAEQEGTRRSRSGFFEDSSISLKLASFELLGFVFDAGEGDADLASGIEPCDLRAVGETGRPANGLGQPVAVFTRALAPLPVVVPEAEVELSLLDVLSFVASRGVALKAIFEVRSPELDVRLTIEV